MPEHFNDGLFKKTLNELFDSNIDSSDINSILDVTLDSNSCLHYIPDKDKY